MNKKTVITICGIGPGNPDLVPKAVFDEIEKADVLIGGERQLELFNGDQKKHYVFNGRLENLKESINECAGMHVVIIVSGDTGFYSLRAFIMRAIANAEIRLMPGISSYQYFYAKLGKGYEKAYLGSLHGKEMDFIDKINAYDSIFLLTDQGNNYHHIANRLVEGGYGDYLMHIGCHLSYENEKIFSLKASDVLSLDHDEKLCVVIIENKKIYT